MAVCFGTVSRVATWDDVPEIDTRLQETFGDRPKRLTGDPVEELVATVLSQHTAGPNSDRALETLRERFPSWELVADADAAELAPAIRAAGLANLKAPRIKAMLEGIREARGAIDLRFLADLPVDGSMAWLRRLPGVGQTTAACVLLFGLDRPAMPVNTGIARVAARLGLVRVNAPSDEVQAGLQASIPAERVYFLHVNLVRHARDICRPREPLCEMCPVNDLCDYFRQGGRSAGRRSLGRDGN
jgi:endonuclease III